MEGIIIYPTKQRLILVLIVVVLLAVAVWIFYATRSFDGSSLWMLVALPILFPLLRAVYLLIQNKPRLVISDEDIVVNTKKPWKVRFADVEAFSPVTYRGYSLIEIRYKKESLYWKPEDEIEEGRKERMLSTESPGAPYEIRADGLSIKSQELLDLLNAWLPKRPNA